ncbi:MAG: hypothetical protein Q9224_006626 [Gallowayella concinna]
MGKNKRKHPDLEEILQRPWCYYCERDFDDLKILINHQKAKHFKCERCGRRLNTAGGLSVHMTQVHKETLGSIENALPNRAGPDIEIFGMEGIPDDIRTTHQQRVIGQFAQAEAERRASTGNPAAGVTASGVKKPKFESPSDIKKRLAEHKAKKAVEQAAGISSGDTTPMGAGLGNQSPAMGHSPAAFQPAGSPGYGQPPMQYGAPPMNHNAYPQPFGQQGPPFQPPQSQPPYPQQPSPFAPPGMQQQFPNNQPIKTALLNIQMGRLNFRMALAPFPTHPHSNFMRALHPSPISKTSSSHLETTALYRMASTSNARLRACHLRLDCHSVRLLGRRL